MNEEDDRWEFENRLLYFDPEKGEEQRTFEIQRLAELPLNTLGDISSYICNVARNLLMAENYIKNLSENIIYLHEMLKKAQDLQYEREYGHRSNDNSKSS